MTNEELRTILREEISGAFVGFRGEMHEEMSAFRGEMREEIGAFKGEMREEMSSFKGEMRGEMSSFKGEMRGEMSSFKDEMREEIHVAISASETRMVQHIDERLLPVNTRLDSIENRASGIQRNTLEIKGDLAVLGRKVDQCTQVLDETTIKIADMQHSLFNLENKVDTYQTTIKQEILRIDTAIQALVQQVFEMNRRLATHIATPWNKAHPDPNSAA